MAEASGSAADTYSLEAIEAPPAKKWGSAAISWIFALFTMGGGSTPVVGPGVRILDADGATLAEIADDVATSASAYALVEADLAELSADAFAARWISGSAS